MARLKRQSAMMLRGTIQELQRSRRCDLCTHMMPHQTLTKLPT